MNEQSQFTGSPGRTPVLLACLLAVIGAMIVYPSHAAAQVVLDREPFVLTLEGYGNVTVAAVGDDEADGTDASNISAGLRALGLLELPGLWKVGARLSAESFDEDVRLREASVLLLGPGGRLEIGERMGLPDVLTGYAPNNFTFTSAEFGPASGPSLDPAGRLQTAFLEPRLAAQINSLTGLGVAAAQFDDQSPKVLYVTPKYRGWLGGLSYANDADDPRYGELVQGGLTHETYWRQNVLRVGGSFAYAQGSRDAGMLRFHDLQSISIGASVTLDDALMLGISASHDGDGGQPAAPGRTSDSAAWGLTTSVNYNHGPWTLGGYYQYGSAEGDVLEPGDDRLSAFEIGASYRWTTRLRAYGAWFHYDFTDEGRAGAMSDAGSVFLLGVRAAL